MNSTSAAFRALFQMRRHTVAVGVVPVRRSTNKKSSGLNGPSSRGDPRRVARAPTATSVAERRRSSWAAAGCRCPSRTRTTIPRSPTTHHPTRPGSVAEERDTPRGATRRWLRAAPSVGTPARQPQRVASPPRSSASPRSTLRSTATFFNVQGLLRSNMSSTAAAMIWRSSRYALAVVTAPSCRRLTCPCQRRIVAGSIFAHRYVAEVRHQVGAAQQVLVQRQRVGSKIGTARQPDRGERLERLLRVRPGRAVGPRSRSTSASASHLSCLGLRPEGLARSHSFNEKRGACTPAPQRPERCFRVVPNALRCPTLSTIRNRCLMCN